MTGELRPHKEGEDGHHRQGRGCWHSLEGPLLSCLVVGSGLPTQKLSRFPFERSEAARRHPDIRRS